MRKQRTTSILFLCFSILVSFYNIYLGKLWLSLFVIPFVLPVITTGKKSKYLEFVALSITSACAVLFMDVSIGIMFSTVLFILFNTITHKKVHSIIFIITGSVIISITTYFNGNISLSKIVDSGMHSGIFVVMCLCIKAYLIEIKNCNQKDHLDQKYLDLIDELASVAHESIDTLKKMQEGK